MSRAALVVDDSATMQEMVGFTLSMAGFKVTRASNGKEALKSLERTGVFELVVTDLNMPEMDGITFIKHLRAISAYRFTPVLMLTTEGGDDRKAQGRAAGASGWLTKPFDPEKLIAVVKKVVR
jgi:two-component system, chemotaxis family, chemotaxis protein CheY